MVNALNAAELFKWLILCYMNCISIHLKKTLSFLTAVAQLCIILQTERSPV